MLYKDTEAGGGPRKTSVGQMCGKAQGISSEWKKRTEGSGSITSMPMDRYPRLISMELGPSRWKILEVNQTPSPQKFPWRAHWKG
ncbi:UNVERIFIED_CONTAM: hypothetical protein K2H54_058339 [Gekko kuhli]